MTRIRTKIVLLGVLLGACAGGTSGTSVASSDATEPAAPAVQPEARPEVEPAPEPEPEPPRDSGVIPLFEDGVVVRRISEEVARREGLTLLDLGDDWAPRVFSENPELGTRGTQPFRGQFVRLANREDRDARSDVSRGHLELYGISPTLDVLRQRLTDDERHTCHDQVDDAPIAALNDRLRPGHRMQRQRRRAATVRILRNRLEQQVRRRRLESIDELADHSRWGSQLQRLRALESELAAVGSIQAHLQCEGTLRRARANVLDRRAGGAVRVWQAQNMIISLGNQIDEATRNTMVMDSREIDLLSTLRTLRERVVDATGLIEDGTASNDWGLVVDRQLNVDDEFRWVSRLEPLEDGAPDLVSRATDAAARALGWTDPERARAWIDEHHPERIPEQIVAVRLPPRPDYHSDEMDLRVEIDRGDVWYDFPYTDAGVRRGFSVRRRPLTVIYARHRGRDIPLVRWNTTIGGWQPEIDPAGGVGLRYKESDVGTRVWRDIIAGPAWLPPPSTPDDELLRPARGGGWRVNTQITGPGYDSAYGLAMVIHHEVRREGEEPRDWVDHGIRSHGSVSYRSILRGYSHGCHRLFNHLAVRMMGFLLAHREHEVRGRIPALVRRELRPEDSEEVLMLEIDNRGFLFELTPPVPVEVLTGRVRGTAARPLDGFYPLPEELQAAAAQTDEPGEETTEVGPGEEASPPR